MPWKTVLFFIFVFNANKPDLCPNPFSSLVNIYQSPKAMQTSGDKQSLRYCCQLLKTALLKTESLSNATIDISFSPSEKCLKQTKYSSAGQGYMWISSPSWMRNCNWKELFLLPWEWYFLPHEDLFFYMFKSSNLTKETDNRSLVSVNDCLLMFQANRRLRRDKGIIFWVSDRKLHRVHAYYNPAWYKEKIPICKVNGTIYWFSMF